jgi:hypothetical protein
VLRLTTSRLHRESNHGVIIRRWLLKQLNTNDTLDAVVLTVKLAVSDKGNKRVAKELRRMADSVEEKRSIRGWSFPTSA